MGMGGVEWSRDQRTPCPTPRCTPGTRDSPSAPSSPVAFRARAGDLERCKDSAWGEDDCESTEAMNSVSQCLWCPYCVPSVPSSCWAQERTICSAAYVVHCKINPQFERLSVRKFAGPGRAVEAVWGSEEVMSLAE